MTDDPLTRAENAVGYLAEQSNDQAAPLKLKDTVARFEDELARLAEVMADLDRIDTAIGHIRDNLARRGDR